MDFLQTIFKTNIQQNHEHSDKNWAHFQKTKYFKNKSFQKISFIKVDVLVKYSSEKKIRKIRLVFNADGDYLESTNLANFE